jgi:hypothetical protein
MEHVANNTPDQRESNVSGYLIALFMLAGVVYVLLT